MYQYLQSFQLVIVTIREENFKKLCTVFYFFIVGDEHKGSGHSHKAYNRGDQSSGLFPDLDFCYGCHLMHCNSVKLPQ